MINYPIAPFPDAQPEPETQIVNIRLPTLALDRTSEEALAAQAQVLLAPPRGIRLAHNFFTHSAHLPITLLALEWLLEPPGFWLRPDPYLLVLAGLLQAIWLTKAASPSISALLLGNLISPAVYSLGEGLMEGWGFFNQPHHQAFWAIAGAFALLQGGRRLAPVLSTALLLAENMLRATIPVVLYAIYETREGHDWLRFFDDEAHVFLAVVVLFLGLLFGLSDITLGLMRRTLADMAARLHMLSSWGFGTQVANAALIELDQLARHRRERSILFADIRGFTAWTEPRDPETVVTMLDDFYVQAEASLGPWRPIKLKFTADQVMAVFAEPQAAFAAARALQTDLAATLAPQGLTVGIGLHSGMVVEGLVGSSGTKAYEVIGDVVNTASRICAAAGPGELWVSLATLAAVGDHPGETGSLQAKGKQDLIPIRVLAPAAPD